MFLRERYTKILHRRGAYMKEDMKSVIADTFSEMLEKEDIDKITVTRLIAQCHISRQTFYPRMDIPAGDAGTGGAKPECKRPSEGADRLYHFCAAEQDEA